MAKYTFDVDSFFDIYKDIYGFKPRSHEFYADDTSDDRRQEIWDDLLVAADENFDAEEEMMREAITAFETTIKETQEIGAADRETALRWIIEGTLDDFDQMYVEGDPTYFNYNFNLPYGYDWKTGSFFKGSRNVFTQKVQD